MFTKDNTDKKITVVIKDFYPKDTSIQKTTEVNEDTYRYLCRSKTEAESSARKDRRYLLAFAFDEIQMGERDGIYSPSVENEYFRLDEYDLLYKAISMLSEYEQELIRTYYFRKKKLVDSEAELGIPKSTLSRHLRKARENIKSNYLKLMLDC